MWHHLRASNQWEEKNRQKDRKPTQLYIQQKVVCSCRTSVFIARATAVCTCVPVLKVRNQPEYSQGCRVSEVLPDLTHTCYLTESVTLRIWPQVISSVFMCVWLCVFFSLCQLKNSLKNDLCLDQGPDNDNVPILYLCHGMTPQVRALSLSLSLCTADSCSMKRIARHNISPVYFISITGFSCSIKPDPPQRKTTWLFSAFRLDQTQSYYLIKQDFLFCLLQKQSLRFLNTHWTRPYFSYKSI